MASGSALNGSCLCNSIRYKLDGAPITTVLCHCKNCKKSSGSSFQANLFFKQDQLTFLAGEDKLTQYIDRNTDSGGTPIRSFCRICGSKVISTNESSDFVRGHVIVMSGCLDGDVKFEPKQEFYCKDKCGWIEVLVDTQNFESMV
ncbi:DUF636 domain protein [Phaeosphaeria sp. MPI-PUGE-AT-0046c]|nr:DUF636 domain protein [Phaeosphaeria sp. MPI-PUGE-AT-0046c]